MFVEIRGRDSTPGSSSEAGGPLSSTLASPTERSMRKDMFSATTRLAENGYGIQKQEPMENELPPGSIAVAAAAAETITGIGTAEYCSNDMEVGSLPSPAPRNDLGLPGYYTEHDIRKLYWQWRTCEEEDRRPNQQSQQSDREDVSMVGADEGDAHDDGGTNDVWTESQHVDRHLRNGPELRHSGQEREDGARSPNKGKSRKVDDAEDAGRHDDAGERRREGSQDPETEEWDIEDEENEDDDDDEDDGEGEDNEEQCDDGYCDSEICDEPRADDWGGKNAVAKRTRTQTRRKRQLRRHYENSAGAPSRAGTSGPGECLRRARAKDDKKHGCEECQKRFSRPSQLRTHQLTHSGEKPHQCPLCDKSFNVASNLKRHIRTHDKIPRKNSRDGSGVFRGFTQGFQAKHNPILKASSPDGIRKARAAKTNLSSSAIISRRSTGTTQPPEKLRWMSTETPESSMMAATRQAKIAANKQRTGEEGASSSANPGSTTSPSEIITRANAQPAAAVGFEAAASVARPLPLTGSSTPGYHPSQPLPPPTPQPSRESDSESTLVEGTQASDGDDDMGNSEPGLDNSDINSHGG
ncbi:hypothetical protein BGZ67_001179 [Mortierella alpina]|nr:hypothetical protein BGZ67_001179 [Mortierella alpina]